MKKNLLTLKIQNLHKRKILSSLKALVFLAVLVIFISSGVNATTYYSSGSGSPNSTAKWWTATNGTGTHPTVFTNAADIFIVQTGCTYTATAAWAISGSLQIQTGGILTTGVTNTWTLTIGGTTSVTGTLTLSNTSVKTFTGDATINSGGIFTISGSQTVIFTSSLIVSTGGTLNHNNTYDNATVYLQVNGDLNIDGTYNYGANLPVIWMNGSGTRYMNTGTTALCKVLLRQGNFYANGPVTINQDFYAMWNQVGGSFHTNGQTVIANWGLVNNGGSVYVDGGSLTVGSAIGGVLIGRTMTQDGDIQVSAGTLNTPGIYLGTTTATPKGTFTQSGGTINTNILDIGNTSSFVQSGGINNVNGSLNLNNSTSTYSHTTGNTTLNIAGNLNNNGVYSTGVGVATINIAGNWFNNFTFTSSATNTVTFNGTGNQVLGGTAATTFNNLVINPSPGVSVTAANTASILSNLTVTTGILDLSTYACNRTTTGGALTLASGTMLKLAGGSGGAGSSNFPNNFTTYTLNSNSTVEYNGTGAQTVYAGATYGYLTLSTGGTKTAGGPLTIAANININTTAIFAGSSFAHTISGNWYNNVSAAAYTPGTSTVTFNGSTAQIIGGTAGNTFNNLVINNANGVGFLQDQSVNATLTLTAGRLNIGAYNLTMATTATAVAGAPFSNTKMIIADGGGEMRKNFSGTGSYVFPIGDNTGTAEYSPITLNVTAGTFAGGAYAGVKLTDAKHPNNASTTDYLTRYWTVSNSGITSPSFNATATYVAADVAGTEANIAAAKYTAFPWVKYGVIGSNTLTTTGITNTGQGIVISGITNAVPVVSITGGGVNICGSASVPLSSTFTNNGTSTISYSWSPAATLSSSTIYNPVATPSSTTTYSLVATDGNGITSLPATSSITVTTPASATISFPASPYCFNVGSAAVTFSGTTGGSYSISPSGASINSTGLIDLSASSPGRFTVTYSVPAFGGCPVYTTNATIVINPNTWMGTVSSNWSTAGNWAGNAPVSASCADVTILAGVPYPPILSSGSATVQNLIIKPGASLIISNATLAVSGTITNSGSLNIKNGTLNVNGSSAQTISGNMFVDSTILNLVVSNPGGVIISPSPGKPLCVTGTLSFGNVNSATLNTGDNIVLVSTATGTASVADITNNGVNSGNSFSGNVFVERYFPARRAWRLVTAPLSGTGTIFSAWQNNGVFTAGRGLSITGPGANPATNGLDVSIQNKTSLKVGTNLAPITNTLTTYLSTNTGTADNKGYFLFVRGDRTSANFNIANKNITTISTIGKLQTGDQNFTASSVGGAYTMIGNPYASPVDFSKLATTNVRNRFYAWDPYINSEQGGYVVMEKDAISGLYVATPPSPGGQTNIIQSSQAIFVETVANGPAAVKFTESSKSSANNLGIFRLPVQPGSSFRSNLYLLEDDGSTILADGNIVQFNNSFNLKADGDDAVKFGNVNENFSVIRDGVSLAIEKRPKLTAPDTIFFKLLRARVRKYQFQFVPANLSYGLLPILQDNYTGKKTSLSATETSIVNFEVDGNIESQSPGRFCIVFSTALASNLKYINIKSNLNGDLVFVEWQTKNEPAVRSYDLEKSIDGQHFAKVNTTMAKPKDDGILTNNWVDVNAEQGDNFYRIKTHTNEGIVSYSDVTKITITNKNNAINVYPNPVVDGAIGLKLTDQPAGQYHVRLLNSLSQPLLSNEITHAGGTVIKTIKAGKTLAKGIYQLEVTKPDNSKTNISVSVQ